MTTKRMRIELKSFHIPGTRQFYGSSMEVLRSFINQDKILSEKVGSWCIYSWQANRGIIWKNWGNL